MTGNLLYAQSGGVTPVINATAASVILEAREHRGAIGKIYAAKNGILGVLNEELIDTDLESQASIEGLIQTPGGAFGSCRYKLRSLSESKAEYTRIIEVFKAHNIKYFLYNGGGDSQDTALKISKMAESMGISVCCVGIPKTIDNDLPMTDTCPGFGSVAKYIATTTREIGLDLKAMSSNSTKVFIFEVMGRHAGWIAASSGLARRNETEAPHIILLPEITFNKKKFLDEVKRCVDTYGYCMVVASEGIKHENGEFVSAGESKDSFGHSQLGGVAVNLAEIVKQDLKLKVHYAIADYMQRSARHLASKTDLEQAMALGKEAVHTAMRHQNGMIPIIFREADEPYKWKIRHATLEQVANVERTCPPEYISANGMHITNDAIKYFKPLIQGEAYPPFVDGLPNYTVLTNNIITKILPDWNK